MGNSSSNTSNIPKHNHILPYEQRLNRFVSDHKAFQDKLLNNTIIDEINTHSDPLKVTEDDLNAFIKKHQSKAAKANIKNFKELIIQLTMEDYIAKHIFLNEYNIFTKIKTLISTLNISQTEQVRLKQIEIRFQKQFEMKMTSSFILYNSSFLPLKEQQRKAIISNISFLSKYQTNILTILITNELIHDDDIVIMLSELIEYSKNLNIVNLILYPINEDNEIKPKYGLDCKGYAVLFKFLKGIACNRYIKSLCLHSIKDYNIVLAPEIVQQIVYKLQSETLFAFHIGNFRISERFAKQFLFQVVSTRSICVLSIESKERKRFSIRDLIKIIEENVSLQVLCFISENIEEYVDELDKYKGEFDQKEKQEDVVYFGKKSVICLDI